MGVVKHPPKKPIGVKISFGARIYSKGEIIGRKNRGGVLGGRSITREENMCPTGKKTMLFDRIFEVGCHCC